MKGQCVWPVFWWSFPAMGHQWMVTANIYVFLQDDVWSPIVGSMPVYCQRLLPTKVTELLFKT
jgi:hypothetical protein